MIWASQSTFWLSLDFQVTRLKLGRLDKTRLKLAGLDAHLHVVYFLGDPWPPRIHIVGQSPPP